MYTDHHNRGWEHQHRDDIQPCPVRQPAHSRRHDRRSVIVQLIPKGIHLADTVMPVLCKVSDNASTQILSVT